MIISALIGFTKDIYPMPQYIRILGMNKVGMTILKQAKDTCKVPIITKQPTLKNKVRNLILMCVPQI